jgi:hypothetical protein
MPVTRLLALSVLLVACTGFAFAQSQENVADLVVFPGAASMNFLDAPSVDQSVAAADTRSDTSSQKEQHQVPLPLILSDHPNSRSIDVLTHGDSDRTCLFIRDYRVVRDSPRSDSTHRDGYTTCVPAARFRMYTTLEQSR